MKVEASSERMLFYGNKVLPAEKYIVCLILLMMKKPYYCLGKITRKYRWSMILTAQMGYFPGIVIESGSRQAGVFCKRK